MFIIENKKLKIVLIILILLLFGIACFCGYKIYSIEHQYKVQRDAYDALAAEFASGEAESQPAVPVETTAAPTETESQVELLNEPFPISVDIDGLRAKLGDAFCGWIYWNYEDMRTISYPVMYNPSNNYYLNHNAEGRSSSGGAIFMDQSNIPDFSDVNTVVHGHHMNDGSMFGYLDKWRKQAFFDAHPYLYLKTLDANYKLRVIAFFDIVPLENGSHKGYEAVFADNDAVQEWVDWVMYQALAKDSTYTYTPGDTFVTLSTCTYTHNNGRGLLICQKIPITG